MSTSRKRGAHLDGKGSERAAEQVYSALASSGRPWSSLNQLGLNRDAARRAVKSLVVAGRVLALGQAAGQAVFAAVHSGTAEECRAQLTSAALLELARGTKLVLLPVTASKKAAAYRRLPSGLRGDPIVRTLHALAQRKEAFFVRAGRSNYAVLAENLRALVGHSAALTVQVAGGGVELDRANLVGAYRKLSRSQKSPNIVIADLQREAGVPLEILKEWLLSECRAHRAVPLLGEPSRATPEQLAASLRVDGRPHIYVRLIEEVSS